MGPRYGPSTLFKTSAEGSSSGGGGNNGGVESSQGNTHPEEPNPIDTLPKPFRDLLQTPDQLYKYMTTQMGILNYLPLLDNDTKGQIVAEAFNSVKTVQTIPNNVSEKAKAYWEYQRVYTGVDLQHKILNILFKRAEQAERTMAETPIDIKTYTPTISDSHSLSIEEHQKNLDILKTIAFTEMKKRFADLNHEQRRLIERNIPRAGCKVITDKSRFEDEDLD